MEKNNKELNHIEDNKLEPGKIYRLDAEITKIRFSKRSFTNDKLDIIIKVDNCNKDIELTMEYEIEKFLEVASCVGEARVKFKSIDENKGEVIELLPLGLRKNIKLIGRVVNKHNIIKAYKVDCEGHELLVSPDIIKQAIRVGGKNVENVKLGFLNLKSTNNFKFNELPIVEDNWFI